MLLIYHEIPSKLLTKFLELSILRFQSIADFTPFCLSLLLVVGWPGVFNFYSEFQEMRWKMSAKTMQKCCIVQ